MLRLFCRRALLPVFLSLAAPAATFGQWFEFVDDFGKPAHEQREPYEERIETERHDFTQSAITVGRGVFQLEGGYSYFYHDAHDEIESSHTAPEMMLRYGLSEDIEFRARWNYAWMFPEEEEPRTGSEDLRLAVKLQLTRPEEDGWIPTTAIELRATAPTGGEAFGTEQVGFSFHYVYQWQLTERMTFAGSTDYGMNGFGDFALLTEHPADDRFNNFSQSAALGFEITENNTGYVEWFGIVSDGRGDETVVSMFNIGIDHYVTPDFVVDFRVGMGLSEDADDFFTGVGGGYRF
jgi:hypothetical protein